MTPYVVSGNTITAFIGGDLKTISSDHPNFGTIKRGLRDGLEVSHLFDLADALRQHLLYEDELVTVGHDGLLFNGEPMDNLLTSKIWGLLQRGQPATPWLNFLKRLQHNPNEAVREELFEWLERSGMPITPDGYFLAYKKVRTDYFSFYDNATLNKVGTTIFLPRDMCDINHLRMCSSGLHFCSWGYLPSYFGPEGRVLILKINPADVIACGTVQKGRACRYTIVDEVPEEEAQHAFPEPVYETYYDVDGGPWPDDDGPTFFGRIKAWTKRLLN